MPIYVGVNGEAKLVTAGYIGNKNNYAVPLFLSTAIPKNYTPVSHIYSSVDAEDANYPSVGYGLVNTGVTLGPRTKIVVIFLVCIGPGDSSSPNSGAGYRFVVGTGGTVADNYFWLGYYAANASDDTQVYANYTISKSIKKRTNEGKKLSKVSAYAIPSYDSYCTYIINNSSNLDCYIKVGDTKTLLGTRTDSNTTYGSTLYLMCKRYTPLCYCAIYKDVSIDITPTKEFYPCIKKDTNEVGLYETVNEIFYTSPNFRNGPAISDYSFPSFEED